MKIRISVAMVGVSAIIGSVMGLTQSAAGAEAAPPALTLSGSSVSASRTIGADAVQLRPDATYELISHRTRTDPSSTEVSEASDGLTVLARVKTDLTGKFSTRFVVPLSWRNDHLIEVRKVKGADLVKQARDWITVTPPRPALALSTGTVHAGSRVGVVVSGLRAHTKYEVFSDESRESAESPDNGVEGSTPIVLGTFTTDTNGRASVKITALDEWRQDHLIEVMKKKGGNPARGANAWLTVVR